jgi:hypothetical protein
MFKIKAFGETIEISPFWVVFEALCRMIEQSAGRGWPIIPPLQNARAQAVGCVATWPAEPVRRALPI